MKKHGPPPCGMYNVGSLLMALTYGNFRPVQRSRAGSERQLRCTRAAQTLAFTLLPTASSECAPLLCTFCRRLFRKLCRAAPDDGFDATLLAANGLIAPPPAA